MKKNNSTGLIVGIAFVAFFLFSNGFSGGFNIASISPFIVIAILIPFFSKFIKKVSEEQNSIKKQEDERFQSDEFSSKEEDIDKYKYDLGSKNQDDPRINPNKDNYRKSYRNETPKPIDDISAMVNKSSKRCHNCNALIDANEKRCPECRAKQKDTVTCPYCGHENPAANALCEKCNGFL